jgi:LPS export ABC transporter protein LptC
MSSSLIRQTTRQIRNGALALFLICCIAACGNDIEKLKDFEPHELPDNTIRQARIQRSERGKLQMLMWAPIIEQYSKPESKTIYREGIFARFFDGYNKPTATLKARYAETRQGGDITLVKDSVVIVDLQRGDTVYLQDLTWDQMAHRVYSPNPVRSKNGQRVTYGDSFESDDAFKTPVIIHQRGTLEWTEEE